MFLMDSNISVVARWEQFFSNFLNVNQSTSHEGSEVYIPEPSLIEVELAIEKLKRHKATGVDHIPSELIQAGGGKLYEEIHELIVLIWNKEELLQEWKNPLLFQFIRKAIEWTLIIIEKFLSCLLHIQFFRTYFYGK